MFTTFIIVLLYRYDRVTASLWIRYPGILLGEGYNGICTLAYYFVAKKCQQPSKPSSHQETEHKKEKKKEKGKRGRKRKAP
jgi:hypothetical protein